jgi:hypothetical protein
MGIKIKYAAEMPHTLYHVTPFADEILNSGLKQGSEVGYETFGGHGTYISFFPNIVDAQVYAETLKEFVDVINGRATWEDMKYFYVEMGGGGLDFDRQYNDLNKRASFESELGRELTEEDTKYKTELMTKLWITNDNIALILGNQKYDYPHLKDKTRDDIKILKVEVNPIEGSYEYNKSENEFRVTDKSIIKDISIVAKNKINVRYAHPGSHLHPQDDSLDKIQSLIDQGYTHATWRINQDHKFGNIPTPAEGIDGQVFELQVLISNLAHSAPIFEFDHVGSKSQLECYSEGNPDLPVVTIGSGDRMASMQARHIFAKFLQEYTLQEIPELESYVSRFMTTLRSFEKVYATDNEKRTPNIDELTLLDKYVPNNEMGMTPMQLRNKVIELTGIPGDKKVSEAVYKFSRISAKIAEYKQSKIDEQEKKSKGVDESKIKKDERFDKTLQEGIVSLKKRHAYLKYLIESLKKINDAGVSNKYIKSLAKTLESAYNLKVIDTNTTGENIILKVESPVKLTEWTFNALEKMMSEKGMSVHQWGEDEKDISNKFTIEISKTVLFKTLGKEFKKAIEVFIDPEKDMPLEKIITTLELDFMKEYEKVINDILKEDIENSKSDKKRNLIDSIKSLFSKTETKKFMETKTEETAPKTEEEFYGESG